MSDRLDRQMLRMTVLLQLEHQVRGADDTRRLALTFVNESHRLVPYQQAAFVEGDGRGRGRVRSVSGTAVPDSNAPYLLWLRRVGRALAAGGRARELHAFGRDDLPADVAADWDEWMPANGLWIPFLSGGPEPRLRGGLILGRAEAWRDVDLHLLGYLQSAYAHAWESARHRKPRRSLGLAPTVKRTLALAAVAGLVALLFVPVRQSSLAPAEIVARDPTLVRAPVEGVVDQVHVRPNQPVDAGQLLVSLDPRRLDSRIEVARNAADVAEAEYRQAAQRAVFDPRARAELARLEGDFSEAKADLAYLRSLRERLQVRALQDGIAVFNDVTEWLGKPVRIGERIMLLADPGKVELDMQLPIESAIRLSPGAEVSLFLNLAPDRPVAAAVKHASYRAQAGPDGAYAYRLKAAFTEPRDDLRLGLKGTAKIYGDRVALGYYLFRRPIGVVRTWLGL